MTSHAYVWGDSIYEKRPICALMYFSLESCTFWIWLINPRGVNELSDFPTCHADLDFLRVDSCEVQLWLIEFSFRSPSLWRDGCERAQTAVRFRATGEALRIFCWVLHLRWVSKDSVPSRIFRRSRIINSRWATDFCFEKFVFAIDRIFSANQRAEFRAFKENRISDFSSVYEHGYDHARMFHCDASKRRCVLHYLNKCLSHRTTSEMNKRQNALWGYP